MSVPFRSRNPVIIGAVSLAVIAALILAAFRAQDLPLIGGGDTYYAAFTEAGGLKPNDEVRIAGVRVGKVEKVELAGDHVRRPPGRRRRRLRDETHAAIKVKTMLGAMYLALQPAGAGQLEEESEIPLERTTSPYNVIDAFSGLAEKSAKIDHRPAGRVPDDARRPDPQHTRGVQVGPRRRVPAVEQHRGARRQINSLLQNLERSRRCSTTATRTSSR
jgi:phospholipid/cholesterol/gamma-HCH transport system substrate-binding protein